MSWRGTGEIATHELSLIFALLTIPVAYWFGASLFGRRTGLVAATIAALSTYLTVYAQETRMYALMTLLAVIIAGLVRRDLRQASASLSARLLRVARRRALHPQLGPVPGADVRRRFPVLRL